jgi:hypothetical protein
MISKSNGSNSPAAAAMEMGFETPFTGRELAVIR